MRPDFFAPLWAVNMIRFEIAPPYNSHAALLFPSWNILQINISDKALKLFILRIIYYWGVTKFFFEKNLFFKIRQDLSFGGQANVSTPKKTKVLRICTPYHEEMKKLTTRPLILFVLCKWGEPNVHTQAPICHQKRRKVWKEHIILWKV